jgi:hypothetical protein
MNPAKSRRGFCVFFLPLHDIVHAMFDRAIPPPAARRRMAFRFCAILALLLPSVYWVARDVSIWPWDQSWYGEVSVNLWHVLTHQPFRWPEKMLKAFATKAPGIALLGQFFVPFGRLFGSIETGLLCSVILVQLGTLILIFKIARRWLPERRGAAFIPVLLVSSAPLFVGLSHQYFVEPLQLFAVTYFYWIAVVAPSQGRRQILGHLLLATGLAMLAKASSPLYCFLPGCIAVYFWFRPGVVATEISGPARRLLVGGAVLFGAAVAWYGRNFSAIKDFVQSTSGGSFALDYGKKAPFFAKLQFWLGTARLSFFWPGVVAALCLALLVILVVERRGLAGLLRRKHLLVLAVAAFLEIVVVLSVFSWNINECERYLLPLLPALAVLLMVACSLARGWLRAVLATILLAQWVLVNAQSLGLPHPAGKIVFWVRPFGSDQARMSELRGIAALTCVKNINYRFNIVGVELSWLNFNTLSFYASQQQFNTRAVGYFTSLGYAQNSPEQAWQRLRDLHIVYFISLQAEDQLRSPNFLNQVSLPILTRIEHDTNFVRVPFDSQFGLVVFRNDSQP